MQKILIYLWVVALILPGCGLFGPDVETNQPTPEQIARCRSEMYLVADLSLDAKGLKLMEGPDTAMWFTFEVAKQPLDKIFQPAVVDVAKFAPGVRFTETTLPVWWDVQGKTFFGGNVALPNVRYMQVGIAEQAETLRIYIMWHET
jgi:hypothetical protein